MRVHTDVLRTADFWAVIEDLDGVDMSVARHGSRMRDRAYEIRLTGNGYRANSGRYGAASDRAATWDEWGIMIGRLYEIDPSAWWGSKAYPVYRDAEHFHHATGSRFEPGTDYAIGHDPNASHRRHRWEYQAPRVFSCKCGAVQRRDLIA